MAEETNCRFLRPFGLPPVRSPFEAAAPPDVLVVATFARIRVETAGVVCRESEVVGAPVSIVTSDCRRGTLPVSLVDLLRAGLFNT